MNNLELFKDICTLHDATKGYLIKCEALLGKTIVQPIKEFRDAYDHLLKTFFKEDTDQELIKNLNAAYSHEFRAFMDTLDYYCCGIFERITALVSANDATHIKSIYKDYYKMTKFIFKAREDIVVLRKERNDDPKGENIRKYQEIADRLEKYHQELSFALSK